MRILRSQKNRFGTTSEIGAFEMAEEGLIEIENLSGILFAGSDGEEEKLFGEVNLTGPSVGKGGKQRFDMDCKFPKEGAE